MVPSPPFPTPSPDTLLRDTVRLGRQAVPDGIAPPAVQAFLLNQPDVVSVHDRHVWSPSSGDHDTALTAHLVRPGAAWPRAWKPSSTFITVPCRWRTAPLPVAAPEGKPLFGAGEGGINPQLEQEAQCQMVQQRVRQAGQQHCRGDGIGMLKGYLHATNDRLQYVKTKSL